MSKSTSHQHSHSHQRPHPLANFFNCCLGDEPTPISDKVQQLRENLDINHSEEISPDQLKNGDFDITPDLITGDLINNFPQIKDYLKEIHPLAMLSPSLHLITLEIFLSDLNLSEQQLAEIYQKLNSLIRTQK
jgi:hypothetical protein